MEEYEKYEYISFDIFDTLIKRNINNPIDIFFIVEQKFNEDYKSNVRNFCNKRIIAENKARKKKNGEVTLNEIYNELYGVYEKWIVKKLKEYEIKEELRFCQRTKDTFVNNLYEWGIKNKKIIIVSDMYLEEKTIKNILKNANIKYSYLFLSSSLNMTKNNGDIYKYLLKKLNIDKNKIIHIGDNYKSDILMARKNGIDCIQVEKTNEKLKNRSIDYNILKSFIFNNEPEEYNYFQKFGYEKLGPILYGYINWLIKNLNNNNVKKVFFLSRDGLIMKKAFDIVNDNKIKSYYLYGSRRALIVPSLFKYESIEQFMKNMTLPTTIKITLLLKKLGLEDIDLNIYTQKEIIDVNKIYNLKDEKDYQKIIVFLKILRKKIILNSKLEYENLLKYLKSINFTEEEKVSIVDIGWHGTMQNAIKNLFSNIDIYGFYLGVKREKKFKDLKMYGYIFSDENGKEYFEIINTFVAIVEFIFMARHGSVKKIDKNGNPEMYEYEFLNTEEDKIIENIQKGALRFVKDFTNSKLSNYEFTKEAILYDLISFGTTPELLDIKNFINVKFNDLEFKSIINYNGPYKGNIKKIFEDFKESNWKIGFLKKIIKLNLNYYNLYKFFKKYSKK